MTDALLADVVRSRDLNEVEARRLVDGIRADVSDLGERIATAYKGRAWVALGYQSWDALCDAEFQGARLRIPREDRAEQVQSLRAAGLSTRAIGTALGIGKGTVDRDLATAPSGAVEQPTTVRSLDGRARPATQPARPQTSPPPVTPTSAGAAHADRPAMPGGGEPDVTIAAREQFIADRQTGEVMSVHDWQAQQDSADLDRQLHDALGPDHHFRSNLVAALDPRFLSLAPHRVAETYQPGSNAAEALDLFLTRVDTWLAQVRAGLPRPGHLRSVR